MGETIGIKYRAFLSYSHTDTGWAKWLHARLEDFRIDRELVGRETPLGPVPKSLRPIFRDREDFSGGHVLTEATLAALDASAALIVLCSPVAASRPAVNEEVRLFRSRHPDRPVIPVIIDGTSPENFPLALRFELEADGTVTDRPVTILSPDLHEAADGKRLGLAKIVAGLTGLSPDDVYRRAERSRRRQGWRQAAVAAVIALLAIVGGAFIWRSYEQQQRLSEVAALVDRYRLVNSTNADSPGSSESLTQAITAIAEGAGTDPRYAKALELLKAGKPREAEPLLKAVAEDKARRADKNAKDAGAAYRNLASITEVSDPRRAREYYAEAARLDPSDVWGMYLNGLFQQEAAQLDAAMAAYERVIAAAKPGNDERAVYWAQLGIGEIQSERGELKRALAIYHAAEALADRMAKIDTANVEWPRYRSASRVRIGAAQFAQGDLAGALNSYRDSLAVYADLAKSNPSKAGWQRGLSLSHQRIGDVQVAQGDLTGALDSYGESLSIAARLAKSNPGNTDWLGDLSVSLDKVANMRRARGDLAGALTFYRDSFTIRDHLAKSDPGNAGWQHDLSVAIDRVGDVQVALGDLASALTSYRDSLAIADSLAKTDPRNADWQRDLSVSYIHVGDVQVARGDLPSAQKSYRDSLDIAKRLSKSDLHNAHWQRDLSVALMKVGEVEIAQGNLVDALAFYRNSSTIRDRLAKSDLTNASWQYDLSVAIDRIGDVQVALGDLASALNSYRDSLGIADRLAKTDPRNADWQHNLSVSYTHIGDVQFVGGGTSRVP